MVALLSRNNNEGLGDFTCKSFKSWCNQTISQEVAAKARYSTSAEDLDIVCCFFAFHDTKASPKNIKKRVVDLQESRHEVQSTFEKTLI